ncbi:MAG: hypothetical protein V4491_05620 [Pseudomonadota bacterium]
MKTILTAIALTIALPAMAHGQTAPAPAPKASDHANMTGMMNCKGTAVHKAGGGHDMAGMKGDDMAAMKGHDMAGMTKQDHEKMMLACGGAAAKGATTPSAVQPTHKM